jgi:transposase
MNRLKVNQQEAIVALYKQGWSQRRISRELGVDREAVRRYIAVEGKPPTPHTGSGEESGSKPPTVQTGIGGELLSKPPRVQNGSQVSLSAPWREQIEKGFRAGYSIQRIHEDLVTEHGFRGSYYSVRRLLLRLHPEQAQLPFRRMECGPGEELQVDFGQGAWVMVDGKLRKTHLFRCVLGCSRKGYSEVVWRQTTEQFIRCLENAFRHFGGVTATVVIDNLKAGVIRANRYDPDLNPKLEEFARHYGTVIVPCKPAMPRHKGKVEAGVKYAQNALKGREFDTVTEQNQFLANWEQNTADKRIHGTTRQQVGKFFAEVEKPALRPLPQGLFPVFEEAKRTVHRDGHVEFKKAYYSVPPEYTRRTVWVRHESNLIRVYNQRREQIALHPQAQPGKFTTDSAHLHSHKRHIIERGADYLLERCQLLGKYTATWAEAMYQARGPQGLRVMQGLLRLAEKYPVAELENAARTATHHGTWRLHDLKRLLDLPGNVIQLDFLETHPLIRSLDAYRISTWEEQETENQPPCKPAAQ